jgi:uncharacterized membrane protein YeaQ/YmgE (transglycosylase-associated protein family)
MFQWYILRVANINTILLNGGNVMNIILWIIFGALAGWLASIIMKTNAQMGALANIIVGIVGALIGGFIMDALGTQGITGFNLPSLLVAIGGAIVLLFLVRLFRRA